MLATFIFIKPDVEVKLVIHAAPPDLDEGDVELGKQRDPDTEVRCRLFLGQTPGRRQRQAVVVHVSFPKPCGIPSPARPTPWLCAWPLVPDR